MEALKVSLRDFRAADAPAVHRWFNNSEATRTLLEQRQSFSEDEARAWVERAAGAAGEDRKFAVVVDGEDEPVGFTALYGLARQTAPELGIMIGEDAWRGRGVGREAERLTLEAAFAEHGAHRVYLRIPAINEPSKAAARSLGLRHEGTMRDHIRRPDGELIDVELWAVLPDEFRAATG